MKKLFPLALLGLSTLISLHGLQAADADFGVGTLHLLDGYKQKKEQGIDSICGEILDKQGKKFLIYDIGAMAGIVVQPNEKKKYTWFRTLIIDGHPAYLALSGEGKTQEFQATLLSSSQISNSEGANFFGTIQKPSDLADAMLMLQSFRWKKQK